MHCNSAARGSTTFMAHYVTVAAELYYALQQDLFKEDRELMEVTVAAELYYALQLDYKIAL